MYFVGATLAVARFWEMFSICKRISNSGQPQGLPLQCYNLIYGNDTAAPSLTAVKQRMILILTDLAIP
jgi:hypothetical protein